MESIEADYDSLKGTLPKQEYNELDDEILRELLLKLNPEELKTASGDIFGRIYEYFLTQFADLKAHDGGEYFTPVSLVSLIAHVLEPERGSVLDPACGLGGMFVQSARFVEQMKANPAEALTFYGMEKNPATIRLARMNLAVHGLEGDIKKAISYYEDPHELLGKADYVMANPPFNTDEVDAKVISDPRLPFGLPGVNKKGKVSNGNYIWISYFYSYLSEKELKAKDSDLWSVEINGSRRGGNLRKAADAARRDAVEQLKLVRYFYKQAHWLLSRFPDGELRDVEGLVKLVSHKELEANDWSLTPGRYVGVASEEVDEDFDFEEALRDIHVELAGLNEEATELAAKIARNFEELGI